MKKSQFLSAIALLALMAVSCNTASAAPDTGPGVDNDIVFETSSTGAADTYDIASMAVCDEANVFITSSYALIDKDAPEQSDHPAASSCVMKKYMDLEKIVNVNSTGLAAVEPERRTCASKNVTKDRYNLDLENSSTGLAAMTATASANLRHSVAWVTSYLSGGELRC